ncbi:ABC transporter ATP-binding protein [Veillonella criceti]|uniref:Iron(3+)-hydroxamate import ATP-binding protein FhuC n=1 Tax=Veillonella criceti TaxID=103891 RepID=A0A380NJX5_9FIRM|nr:ABC transporter ATP-binding protein [Veillonella criceti]SUP41570.1 Iron(3+)-hydroxamate import ATP-binding protein FhuC [Veillonella criceti]
MELAVHQMSVSLSGQVILHNVSATIRSGEFVGIIGPNGSGKTTFLKSLRGLSPIQSGEVILNGHNIKQLTDKQIARQVSYMQQNISLNFGYTAKEIVLTARYPYLKWWQNETSHDKAIVDQVMKDVGIWSLRHRTINELSGGERQRVFLAKALAQDTDLLLLDEPTAALDLVYADEIFRQGKFYCEQGKGICIVVHDLELAAKFCTRLLLFSEGRLLADGTPRDVLTAGHLKEAFQLAAAVYEDPYFKQQRIFVFPKDVTTIEQYRTEKPLPKNISIALRRTNYDNI